MFNSFYYYYRIKSNTEFNFENWQHGADMEKMSLMTKRRGNKSELTVSKMASGRGWHVRRLWGHGSLKGEKCCIVRPPSPPPCCTPSVILTGFLCCKWIGFHTRGPVGGAIRVPASISLWFSPAPFSNCDWSASLGALMSIIWIIHPPCSEEIGYF